MAVTIDPARELADLADKVKVSDNRTGVKFLASQFEVDPWSTDFVKIIACILERADLVGRIVKNSDLDTDDQQIALSHLNGFKQAFVGDGLNRQWNEAGFGLTNVSNHGSAIRFMSATVKQRVKYPRLTEEETNDMLVLIDFYLERLIQSDEGPDFVRQAIADGLTTFRFQLEKVGWMGSGYALEAFQQLKSVYEASERAYAGFGIAQDGSPLGGFLNILKSYKSKIDTAKGWYEAGETLWKGYQFISSAATPLLLTSQLGGLPGA
jgi:hypothetical protein